jgi:hypothetical protein
MGTAIQRSLDGDDPRETETAEHHLKALKLSTMTAESAKAAA